MEPRIEQAKSSLPLKNIAQAGRDSKAAGNGAERLERESQPRADAALVLREDEDRAVAQHVRAIAFRKHVSHVE